MKPLQGFLQGVFPHRIRGWAYDPNEPQQHLTIEVRLDGALVTTTFAAQHFPDLEQKHIGNGDHGFVLQFDPHLPLDSGATLEVIAIAASGERRILHQPNASGTGAPVLKTIQATAGAKSPAMPAFAPLTEAHVPPINASPGHPLFQPSDSQAHPVFVLGSARSGTTAMVRALTQLGRYEGYNEGHFLPLALRLEQVVHAYYGKSARDAAPGMKTLVAHIPQPWVRDFLQAGFATLLRSIFPTGHWLDKTPGAEMVRAAPLMRRIWPNARFIFMRRDPVDNIESRRRKFPTFDFADHCRLWAEAMMAWYHVRDTLTACSLEVDQLTLARHPDLVSPKIATLLGLPENEAEKLQKIMSAVRPQTTGSDPQAHVTLADVDWSETERAIFASVCAEPARLFGY